MSGKIDNKPYVLDVMEEIKMDFSLCDEYSCGIQICSSCLRKMLKMLDEARQQGVEL